MKNLVRLISNRRGQTLIEFAFIAPIIFLFLFTIVDFGIALDRRIVIQHAVREGARYAAVNTYCKGIRDATAAQAQDIINASDVTVFYEDAAPPDANGRVGDAGDPVRVSAHFTYQLAILDTISEALGVSAGSIDMSPSASARLELAVTNAADINASGCPP